jgi:tetrahydromethanopterin S-methyltransferase subunit G
MPKYAGLLYEFLTRLPFFFAAHTIMLYFAQDTSALTSIVLFLSFMLIFVFDMAIQKPKLGILFGLVTGGLLLLIKFPAAAVLVWCITLFKNYLNATVQQFFWIIFHLIISIIIPSASRMTAMAYILFMMISFIICGLTDRLSIFLYSNYCRESSKKTIANIMARHYSFTVPLLLLIAVICFAAMLPKYPEEIKKNIDRPTAPVPQFAELEGYVDFELLETEIEPEEEQSVETLEWAEHFLKVMKIIGQVIGFLFAGVLIFWLFSSGDEKKIDLKFEDYPDDIEESPFEAEEQKMRNKNNLSGLNWVVRRLFYIKVRMQRRWLLPKKSDTANILAEKIKKIEDISALNRLYHRARYSDEEIKRIELKG